MGGLMRFLLGGVIGAVLGFFLSRLRGGTSWKKPVQPCGERMPATDLIQDHPRMADRDPLAGLISSVAAAEATGSVGTAERSAEPFAPPAEAEDLAQGPEDLPSEAADSLSIREWESTEGWPSIGEEVDDRTYSQFDWAPLEGADTDTGSAVIERSEEPMPSPEPGLEEREPESVPPIAPGSSLPEAGPGVGKPPISAEDLRLRIEESRRRIRQELEEPFAMPSQGSDASSPLVGSPDEVVVPPRVPVVPPEVPPRVPEVPPSPGVSFDADILDAVLEETEGSSPAIEIQPVDDSLYADLGVRVDGAAIEAEPDDLRSRMESARQASEEVPRPSPEELETSLSFDAMRARVEETRNRLKAKAVDARVTDVGDVPDAGSVAEFDAVAGAGVAEAPASGQSPADTEAEIAAKIDKILGENID